MTGTSGCGGVHPENTNSASEGNREVGGVGAAQRTYDVNVRTAQPLLSPQKIREIIPITPAAQHLVVESRKTIKSILGEEDRRLLVIVGPCSIHDEVSALEYADRLRELASEVADRMHVVMRVYFEKPRTTIGWKGLINDPHMDGTFDLEEGLQKARRILLAIIKKGVPAATEMLDPIIPQYIADLISWTAIGARTTESQTHREMASGLSMPVGFKNSTGGNMQVAVDAMTSALHQHSFLGIDEEGRTAVIRTRGNQWGHLVLRGGRRGPNYHCECIAEAAQRMRDADLPTKIMVDCSHANCKKKFQYQEVVWQSVVRQRAEGNTLLIGAMLESNLFEGNQPFRPGTEELRYGVSITDECIGWDKTVELLRNGHALLGGKG